MSYLERKQHEVLINCGLQESLSLKSIYAQSLAILVEFFQSRGVFI